MDILRNVSNQPIIIQKKAGIILHCLPGRAVGLTDEERQSSQVQSLLRGGLMELQKLEGKATESLSGAAEKDKVTEAKAKKGKGEGEVKPG